MSAARLDRKAGAAGGARWLLVMSWLGLGLGLDPNPNANGNPNPSPSPSPSPSPNLLRPVARKQLFMSLLEQGALP